MDNLRLLNTRQLHGLTQGPKRYPLQDNLRSSQLQHALHDVVGLSVMQAVSTSSLYILAKSTGTFFVMEEQQRLHHLDSFLSLAGYCISQPLLSLPLSLSGRRDDLESGRSYRVGPSHDDTSHGLMQPASRMYKK